MCCSATTVWWAPYPAWQACRACSCCGWGTIGFRAPCQQTCSPQIGSRWAPLSCCCTRRVACACCRLIALAPVQQPADLFTSDRLQVALPSCCCPCVACACCTTGLAVHQQRPWALVSAPLSRCCAPRMTCAWPTTARAEHHQQFWAPESVLNRRASSGSAAAVSWLCAECGPVCSSSAWSTTRSAGRCPPSRPPAAGASPVRPACDACTLAMHVAYKSVRQRTVL